MTSPTPNGFDTAGTHLITLMLIRAFLPYVAGGTPWTGRLSDARGQAVLDMVRPRLDDDEQLRLSVLSGLARHGVTGLALALRDTGTDPLTEWLDKRVGTFADHDEHRSELIAARLVRLMVGEMAEATQEPVDVPDGVAATVEGEDADMVMVSLSMFCAGMLLHSYRTVGRALQVVDSQTRVLLPDPQ